MNPAVQPDMPSKQTCMTAVGMLLKPLRFYTLCSVALTSLCYQVALGLGSAVQAAYQIGA